MLCERSRAIDVARLGLVEKADTFLPGAASHPPSPGRWMTAVSRAAPRARRAMRLRRYQQRSCLRRGSCSGYAVRRGEKAPDDALARELGAMGLL